MLLAVEVGAEAADGGAGEVVEMEEDGLLGMGGGVAVSDDEVLAAVAGVLVDAPSTLGCCKIRRH